jgi:amino acid adenylation domain-containing protein
MPQEFQLSPQQRHLWSLQRGGQPTPFRARCEVSIEGVVEAEALRAALRSVVLRHEILRTGFRLPHGADTPLQVISERPDFAFDVYDLRDDSTGRQERRLAELFDDAGRLPFDFEHGPLLHASLVALDARRHALLLTLPALCADAASLQYADISEWLNELLASPATELGREYWWKKFGGSLPPPASLPFERRGVGVAREFAPRCFTSKLQPALVEALDRLVGEDRDALFAFLAACWQALLLRYTEQSGLVVGASFDGRPFAELSAAAGLLARHLPVRSIAHATLPLMELFSRTQESMREASRWQASFSWEGFDAPAVDSDVRLPFCIGYEERAAPRRASGATFNVRRQSVYAERCKVQLQCVRQEATLSLEFHYDENLYSEAFIEHAARSFASLVASAAARPETALAELEIVCEEARRQILFGWNETQAEYPRDTCLQELFEQQAERTPDAVALVFAGEELSYAELNRRANRLAHYLRGRGVEPESRVGLMLERSVEMLVGVLGVLKAGGAYVPLDPAFPATRLQFMLEDSGLKILLTQTTLNELVSPQRAAVVLLNTLQPELAAQSSSNPQGVASAENLAYVIYTSGSTGRPKGVCIQHRAVVNFLDSMSRQPGLTPLDVLLSLTTLSFDIAALELFLPLTVGARVVLGTREVAADGRLLQEALDASRATVLQATPATWRMLLDAGWPGDSGLKILCGGEALPTDLAGKLLKRGSSFWNLYGPTETTVWSTARQIQAADQLITIGRPIANTQVYLLDPRLKLVPVGVTGELYIGGDGVARGYLNRADLTAERFIPDPFSAAAGARLYRTGDLARYLPDGDIEYLGRADQQVKVRGFRIELGEIEIALSQHPAVKNCVVASRDDETSGGKQLVAYIVARAASPPIPTPADLRAHLRHTLPEHMIPSSFVTLDALPLTPNGKLDRRGLPASDFSGAARTGDTFAPPRTPIEEVIANIWSSVLGLERVGRSDNFFDLGGHSLLATRLVSRLGQTFGVELPLRALFEHPTVGTLAEVIEQARRAGTTPSAPPLERVERSVAPPLSFAQQRLWFLDQLESGTPLYNIPAAIRLSGHLDVAALSRALTDVVQRHEALRTTFAARGGEAVQIINEPQPLDLPVTNLSALSEPEREAAAARLCAEEAARPFDLSTGPLLRVSLLQLGEAEHVLMLTMHHIVSDGWSAGVLVSEVGTLYAAFTQGKESPLTELPIQYADYAAWQRERVSGEFLNTQLAYWRQQLDDLPPVLELPTDRPRPAVQSFAGSTVSFALGSQLSVRLRELARREGVTLFMLLLAGFEALLYRYTGQAQFAVGTPVANRTRGEVEGLVGFFVNTLALRADVSGEMTFRELLVRVREVALGGYEHQEVAFERVVEELQPERSLSHAPLFQVVFTVQEEEAESGGLQAWAARRSST